MKLHEYVLYAHFSQFKYDAARGNPQRGRWLARLLQWLRSQAIKDSRTLNGDAGAGRRMMHKTAWTEGES